MTLQPWPVVDIRGELEPAEGEWLHTNGAGAYAMSTLALMHTRRFHGLFIAALEPPLHRHVIVSHAETSVRVGKKTHALSTHQFPDIAPTPGYRSLQSFAQDPLPRWTYRVGQRGELERTLCLVRGENALIGRYVWRGKNPASLTIRPLMPMRPIHELRHEQSGFVQKVAMRRNEVSIQPVAQLPEVVFGYSGVFTGSPDWWRRFEYSEDQRRHVHFQEDLWTPGTFELPLLPNEPAYLVVAIERLPRGTAQERFEEVEQALRALDPGPSHAASVRALAISAEQFRVSYGPRRAVLAGYPWLGVRARDALIALPGLYYCQGLIEDAKQVLATIIADREDGFLVAVVPEPTQPQREISVDASLWLFETTRHMCEYTTSEDPFVRKELYPVLCQIFERVHAVPRSLTWLTDEGLIVARGEAQALTWMDSRAGEHPVTPRHGLAIEMQSLWYRACETLAALAHVYGEDELASRARQAADRVRQAFRRRFWCQERGYAFDCIDEESLESDAAIRPNALIALTVSPELFESWQAQAIVTTVKERLLTPLGVRSLEPDDPSYIGYYEGGMEARQAAYHQGVVWIYLLGFYARAALRLQPDDFELQMDLKELMENVAAAGPVLSQVAQVASGDPPQKPAGCPAQAWSLAEVLRTLWDDLSL